MKVVILAGGMGSRLAEETDVKPKPMVEIGGKPILWHIMQHYSAHGFNEFVLALGYKGEVIKRYIVDYCKLTADLTIKVRSGDVLRHQTSNQRNWTVDLVDTGQHTQTGGRLKRLREYVGNNAFMLTYGDGVSDVNLKDLLAFHKKHKKIATVTAVRPPARFGHMEFDNEIVSKFSEKSQAASGWINGGFFVFEPKIFDFIGGDETWLEREPLETCSEQRQLVAYKHEQFWQCVDTLRDRKMLEELWDSGKAPWKTDRH